MKVFIKILSILSVLLLLVSCSDNLPTELVTDNLNGDDGYDLELLSPEPGQFYYANGYDSTGVISNQQNIASFLSVTKIEDRKNTSSLKRGIGTAIFFDTTRSVLLPNGRFLSYKTRLLGRVFFDNDSALLLPYKRKFIQGGTARDTALGFFHLLSRRGNSPGHQGGSFSNTVRVRVENPLINTIAEFTVEVPGETNGTVKVIGSRLRGDLAFELNWDASVTPQDRIDIIIGGTQRQNQNIFPLFRIRTADDGHFVIPVNLLRRIPFTAFDDVVVSFIRRNQIASNHNILGFTHIAGQNIQNIRVNVN